MRILLIGSGGREHALADAIKRSKHTSALFVAPGNAGIAKISQCVQITTNAEILNFCLVEKIDFVVVGPEAPLVDGLADILRAAGIKVFGPAKIAAQLEGSKAFMKNICAKYNIPSARFAAFSEAAAAIKFAHSLALPVVVKADGLAAGKGVVIAENYAEAESAISGMLSGNSFGNAGKTIVIEEFLVGEEISLFALCDGRDAVYFGSAQDHKRVGDGDTGPNTGGMGTYAPAPILTDNLRDKIMRELIKPTVSALIGEGIDYRGVLFAGIMITAEGPKLLEYNIRFGDPETQVLMARLESDLVEHLLATENGNVAEQKIQMREEAAICVVMASAGYPGSFVKNTVIKNLEQAEEIPNVTIYHAATRREENGDITAQGGRVLGVTAIGKTVVAARESAYQAVDAINWPEGFCRRDIAWRAIPLKV